MDIAASSSHLFGLNARFIQGLILCQGLPDTGYDEYQ